MSQLLKNVSIIIPTYNEKDNIPFLIQMIVEALSNVDVEYEILLVDDNSPDGTAEVYDKLRELMPNTNLLLRKRSGKLGLGSAYVEGLKYTKYDFVLILDADLSHNPKYIADMIRLQRKGEFDIVSGTRYAKGGGASGWDWKRILVSKTANFLAQVLLRPTLSDLTGSFRLYRRSVLETALKHIHSKGYVFQVEIAVRAEKQMKSKVAELPIVFTERIYGESKLDAQEIIWYLVGLMKLFWEF